MAKVKLYTLRTQKNCWNSSLASCLLTTYEGQVPLSQKSLCAEHHIPNRYLLECPFQVPRDYVFHWLISTFPLPKYQICSLTSFSSWCRHHAIPRTTSTRVDKIILLSWYSFLPLAICISMQLLIPAGSDSTAWGTALLRCSWGGG